MSSAIDGDLLVDSDAGPQGLRVWICEPFRFFFSLDNSKTSPANLADTQGHGVPDDVRRLMNHLRHAFHVFVVEMALPNPCQSVGETRRPRFIDVHLDDLPIQRGLASAAVAEVTPAFLKGSPWDGASMTLKLHRSLPVNTQTPAHELFHLFQYSALPYRNMWFMEGLARHAQRWVGNQKPRQEPLPKDRASLESMLARWHEAEPLWNRLSALCAEGTQIAQAPDPAHGHQQACPGPWPVNLHLRGHRLIATLFETLQGELAFMQTQMPLRDIPADATWGSGEHRSASNNRWLLRGLIRATERFSPAPDGELGQWLHLVQQIDAGLGACPNFCVNGTDLN